MTFGALGRRPRRHRGSAISPGLTDTVSITVRKPTPDAGSLLGTGAGVCVEGENMSFHIDC